MAAVPETDASSSTDVLGEIDSVPIASLDGANGAEQKYTQETLEIEVLPEGVEGAKYQWQNCPKNPGHSKFIPISEFTIQHLPKEYRRREYLELVELMSKLTVKVSVSYTSEQRPPQDIFYPYRGTSIRRTGSGFFAITSARNISECIDSSYIYYGDAIEDNGENGYPWKNDTNFDIEKSLALVKRLSHPLPPSLEKWLEDKNIFRQVLKALLANDGLQAMWLQAMSIESGDFEDAIEKYRQDIRQILIDKYNASNRDIAKMDDASALELIKLISDSLVNGEEKKVGLSHDFANPITDTTSTHDLHSEKVLECTNSSTPETDDNVIVYTACHVIFDEEEAKKTKIEFFYDDESETGVEQVDGVTLRLLDKSSDICKLLCKINNSNSVLVKKLRDIEEKILQAFWALPTEDKPPLAVICSHPHGYFKHITVGEWSTRWWHPCPPGLHRTSFDYNTPTCPGSSGGPVLILGKKKDTLEMRHLFHSHHGVGGKNKDKKTHASAVCDCWSWKYERASAT